jgi:hypothetical protein
MSQLLKRTAIPSQHLVADRLKQQLVAIYQIGMLAKQERDGNELSKLAAYFIFDALDWLRITDSFEGEPSRWPNLKGLDAHLIPHSLNELEEFASSKLMGSN